MVEAVDAMAAASSPTGLAYRIWRDAADLPALQPIGRACAKGVASPQRRFRHSSLIIMLGINLKLVEP